LSVRQAQIRHARHGLLLEGVDQGGFSDARLPGQKDHLPLMAQSAVQALPQRPERA
jgi:hypothetical protein